MMIKKMTLVIACLVTVVTVGFAGKTEASWFGRDCLFETVAFTMEEYHTWSKAQKDRYWEERYRAYKRKNPNTNISYREFRREFESDMEYYYRKEQEDKKKQQEAEQKKAEADRRRAEEAERQKKVEIEAEQAKQKQEEKERAAAERAEQEQKKIAQQEHLRKQQALAEAQSKDKLNKALLVGAMLGILAFGILLWYNRNK